MKHHDFSRGPDLRPVLFRAAAIVELLVGVSVLLYCIDCGLGLLMHTNFALLFGSTQYFQSQLNAASFIIIGIEFIKMIATHTLDSVLDVMLLAVARQMIIEHTTPLENLLSVIAVAVLFIVRKYLYISQIDRTPDKIKREREQAAAAAARAAASTQPLSSQETEENTTVYKV